MVSATVQRLLVGAPLCLTVHLAARQLDPVTQYAFAHSAFMLISLVIAWQASRLVVRLFQQRVACDPNKSVFITGCDSGFGLQLALALHRLGFTVVAGCLNLKSDGALRLQRLEQPAGCESTADDTGSADQSHPPASAKRMHVLWLDVTSDRSVQAAYEHVRDRLQPHTKLWALVNNAGIGHYAGAGWNQSGLAEHYGASLEVNTLGVVRVTNRMLPLLAQTRGSRILLMSSYAGRFTFSALAAYCMSKHCVRVLGNSLRRELRPLGVRLVLIEPAMYRTSITDRRACLANLERNWQRTEQRQQLYGERHYAEMREQVLSFMRTTRTDVTEVIRTLCEAIRLEEPLPFYRVSGRLEKLLMYALEWFPEELQDFLLDGQLYRRFLKLVEVRKS